MTTSVYNHNVLIVCPVALVAELNHLSGTWGLGLADLSYFGAANYTDALGNKFCVRNTVATENMIENVTVAKGGKVYDAKGAEVIKTPFARPRFDTPDINGKYRIDLTKAKAAAAKVTLLADSQWDVDGRPVPHVFNLTKVLYVVDREPTQALRDLGLTLITKENGNA